MNNKPVLIQKTDQESRQWTMALGISLILHVVLCLVVLVFSHGVRTRPVPMKYIDVDLAMAPLTKEKPAPKAKPAKKKSTPVKKKSVHKKKTTSIKKPAKKTSLSKKKKPPEKTRKDIDKTLDRLEKNLASSKPEKKPVDPIAERLKQMEKEAREPPEKTVAQGTSAGTEETDSPVQASLIQRYRVNVSVEIKENWAFSKALAAGQTRLETIVSFEILPNGDIRGLRLLRRSGNDYMDNAATVAILKSSPVRPHPPGLNKPFIEVRLRFTPEGLE